MVRRRVGEAEHLVRQGARRRLAGDAVGEELVLLEPVLAGAVTLVIIYEL